jgi:hypothetical protein
MKKKLFLMLMALTMSAASFAQFEQGKKYLSASLSGLNVNFTGAEKWKFDVGARVGYMVRDSWMVTGICEFSYRKNQPNTFIAGAGARYYVIQNGLFVGASLDYQHHLIDDFVPNIHIGYAFFLNKILTIEPELYYRQSVRDHSNYSEAGFRIGVGIYLDKIIY